MRRGCPSGKVIHGSQIEAQHKRGKKAPKRAYECPRGCGGWHLTSMTEEEYNEKNPRRAEA